MRNAVLLFKVWIAAETTAVLRLDKNTRMKEREKENNHPQHRNCQHLTVRLSVLASSVSDQHKIKAQIIHLTRSRYLIQRKTQCYTQFQVALWKHDCRMSRIELQEAMVARITKTTITGRQLMSDTSTVRTWN